MATGEAQRRLLSVIRSVLVTSFQPDAKWRLCPREPGNPRLVRLEATRQGDSLIKWLGYEREVYGQVETRKIDSLDTRKLTNFIKPFSYALTISQLSKFIGLTLRRDINVVG